MEKLGFAMKYPEMRNRLLLCLECLSDFSYQKSCWVAHICPDGVKQDELDYSVDFLFDDTTLYANPERYIGAILRNREEADVVRLLCQKIDEIYQKYGGELTDAEYIALPEWNNVLEAAQSALRICRLEATP